jgi:hypothetical protein
MVLYGENFLGSNPEQLLDESRLCPGIALGYPLHSPLPNHVHRFDSFEGSPGALKGVVTLGHQVRFFTVRWSCSITLLRNLHWRRRTRCGSPPSCLRARNGCRVGWILIDIDDARYGISRTAKYLLKEALRRNRIAFGREQEIDGLSSRVHSPIQILLLALHPYIGFIDTVAVVCCPLNTDDNVYSIPARTPEPSATRNCHPH